MAVEETLAKRAEQLVREIEHLDQQKACDSFDEMSDLVEEGVLTREQVIEIQKQLGPVAVARTVIVNPAIQAPALKRLAHEVDDA